MSAQLKRDSGSPREAGNSQAMAFICTTTSGGKNSGATRSRTFLEARDPKLKEALSPEAHDVAADVETSRDLVIVEILGGEQDHLGSQDDKIRQRILPGPLG
jgi:hypothetical protein